MNKNHFLYGLQAAIAASGALGLFVLSFLDSTILPFPTANDLLLIDLSIQFPLRMPFYGAVATLGSVAGCVTLFLLARKGKEAAFRDKGGAQAERIRRWVQRNGFVSVLVGALMPPPMPFKLVILAAGALGMPLRAFVIAVVIARTIRFYGEGFLAVRYGSQATQFLVGHKVAFDASSL